MNTPANYSFSRTKIAFEQAPVSFKTAVNVLLNSYGQNKLSRAVIINELLRFKLLPIEDIEINGVEFTFRLCLYNRLHELALSLFLRVKQSWMLSEEQARKFPVWLVICFYRMQRRETLRLLYDLMKHFNYKLNSLEKRRMKYDFCGFYQPKGILLEILNAICFEDRNFLEPPYH